MGVLFRKGEALQLLKDAKVVAVDKTGTLTEGRPVLTDLEIAEGFSRDPVLAKVAAVESRSEHPIARAIVESATEGGIALPTMTDFDSVTGMGVRATVDGSRVEVGADRYMRSLGLDVGVFAGTAERLGNEGKSPLYAAIDGRLAAIIAVADPIKASTPAAIAARQPPAVSCSRGISSSSRSFAGSTERRACGAALVIAKTSAKYTYFTFNSF